MRSLTSSIITVPVGLSCKWRSEMPGDVNFEELARSCDDFNGAQLKAVCVEAGMLALRREAEQVRNFHRMELI